MRKLLLVAAVLLGPCMLAQQARRAPGFALPDLNGQIHDLQDYRGRVVIVELMRTDCPDCVPFSTKLEAIKEHYGGKVAILSITNPPDSRTNVRKFIGTQKVTYPILFDCGQVAYSYVRPDPLRPSITIPHVYVVDAQGAIRGDYEHGSAPADIFEGPGLYKQIDALVAGGAKAKKP